MTLVEHKRAHPSDDIISRLCATNGVTDDEIASLSMALLFAGHETTVVQIGLQTVVLLTDHDLWRTLLNDPTLIARAVEEMLRITTLGGGIGACPGTHAPTSRSTVSQSTQEIWCCSTWEPRTMTP